MKKSTFDFEPQLVDYEGAVVRINFDVERVSETIPAMGEGEDIVRDVFKANVIRIPQPLTVEAVREELLKEGFSEIKADAIANKVVLTLVLDGKASGDALALAKSTAIAEITEYDDSDNVNGFLFNGQPLWLDSTLRSKLERRFKVEVSAHEATSSIHFEDGSVITINPETGLTMLDSLEYYAKECYEVTQSHKAAVLALDSVEAVTSYNFKTGYPPKLEF